jgi:hypothetical protein
MEELRETMENLSQGSGSLWIRTRNLPNTRQRSLRIGVIVSVVLNIIGRLAKAMLLVQLKFTLTVASNNF